MTVKTIGEKVVGNPHLSLHVYQFGSALQNEQSDTKYYFYILGGALKLNGQLLCRQDQNIKDLNHLIQKANCGPIWNSALKNEESNTEYVHSDEKVPAH